MRPLELAMRHLDAIQAEGTLLPEGCPEPWREWIIEIHGAACDAVARYRETQERP